MTVVAALGLLLACALAYGPGLSGPLFFDDIPNLIHNEGVQIAGHTSEDWRTAALSSTAGRFYRPVAMLSFALNYALADGFTPETLKATNLAIHGIIALLIFQLSFALLGAPALSHVRGIDRHRHSIAFFAAGVWLLHPLHVSTVLFAIQRMAQLSVLFTMLGLWVFTRYRLRWVQSGASSGELLAATLWIGILTTLAILSKENGALLPALILVLEISLFQGIWHGRRQKRIEIFAIGLLLLPLLVVFVLLLISPEMINGRYVTREFTLNERVLTQGRLLWHYISWLLIPNIAEFGFFHDDISLSRSLFAPLTTLAAFIAWATLLIVTAVFRRSQPALLFGLLFYLVAHAMESSWIPLEMVFEHRNYLPSIGVFIALAIAVIPLFDRLDTRKSLVCLALIFVCLTGLLAIRSNAWRNEESLARFNVVNHPLSPRANFYYGQVLFQQLERSETGQLSSDEVKALVVTSREYFLRMYKLAPRDFAALVMLYQLDNIYFPTLARDNDWLAVLEELSKSRRLQRSDTTALHALVSFSSAEVVALDRVRIDQLLQRLMEKRPHSASLLALRFRFLQADHENRSTEIQEMLEQAMYSNTKNAKAPAYLAQFYGRHNLARTYESIGAWLKRDEARRKLAIIREILTE